MCVTRSPFTYARLTMIVRSPRAHCLFYPHQPLASNYVLQDPYVGSICIALVLAASNCAKCKQRLTASVAKAVHLLNDVVS